MKRKATKWLALLLAATLILGEGSIASAAENLIPEDKVIEAVEPGAGSEGISEDACEEVTEEATEEASEEATEEVGEEATEEASEEATEEASEEATEEASEEATEEASEEATEEASEEASEEATEEATEKASEEATEEASEEATEETSEAVLEMFPGLPTLYTFSASEEADRENLSENFDNLGDFEEGVDCVSNEILVNAENEEQAEEYAKAFGGTLKRFIADVAVITLNADENRETATVEMAVKASLDKANMLPAASPNTYYFLHEGDDDFTSIYNDTYLNPKSSYYQWFHQALGSEIAWRNGYTGNGIKVAVLDTGAKIDHEDLGNVTRYTVLEEEDYPLEDAYGHGTHVCGLVAGTLNNNKGGSGVAPDASVNAIKVSETGSIATDNILAALELAKTQNVDLVNMSLGGPAYNPQYAEKIRSLYDAGIAVFCSSGNEGVNFHSYPASYDGAISIAALDQGMQATDFTSFGTKVDFAFPGQDIVSCIYDSTDTYGFKDGTSMACPIAVGTAAVVLQYARENNLYEEVNSAKDVDALYDLLKKASVKASGEGLGNGYVYLPKALNLSSKAEAPELNMLPGTYEHASLTIGFNLAVNTTVYYSTDGKTPTFKEGVVKNGIKYTEPFEISGKTVTVKAIAVDNTTLQVSNVTTGKYTLVPKVNQIILSSDSIGNILQGKTMTVKAKVLPEYAPNKKVTWKVTPAEQGVTVKDGKVSVSKTATIGDYVITATSCDGGNITSNKYVIHVIEKPAVTVTGIKKVTAGSIKLLKGQTTNVEILVSLSDGTKTDANGVYWESQNPEIASITTSGKIIITAKSKGKTNIVGRALDGSGKKLSIPVTVTQGVTGISISGADEVSLGTSVAFKAEVLPGDAANKKLNWSVSPTGNGVTVKNGKVSVSKKAVLGTYTLKATSTDGTNKYGSVTFNVVQTKITGITFNETSMTLFRVNSKTGGSASSTNLGMVIKGTGTDNWEVTSSNDAILRVVKKDKNTITMQPTGKGTGKVTVTVKATDGSNKKATCKVSVENPPSNMWVMLPANRCANLVKGKSMNLKVVFEEAYGPISKESRKLLWYSTNTDSVKVDKNGKVTAVKNSGSARINVSTSNGAGMSTYINIYAVNKPKEIFLEGNGEIKLGTNNAYYIGYFNETGSYFSDSLRIRISSGPTGGLGYRMSWGSITLVGNKKGTYKVTIYSMDGSNLKKTYTIKVIE